ncbi:MAG: hypothetical protein KME64_00720 [Scytonematopsis contorta HA4267-MV1]|nr:hypothetical protein [Scytonematopsis contorta HA4267-MV1]
MLEQIALTQTTEQQARLELQQTVQQNATTIQELQQTVQQNATAVLVTDICENLGYKLRGNHIEFCMLSTPAEWQYCF